MKKRFGVLAGVLLCSWLMLAQEPAGPEAAKAKLAEAKTAAAAKDTPKAIAAAKEAVDLDPTLSDAIDLFGRLAPKEERNTAYEEWAAKYPDKAVFAYKLADANLYDDYQKAAAYAKKALAIDPKYAAAYMTLSLIAEAGGDDKLRREYLKKAAEAQPQDPSWSFYYAMSWEHVDPQRYRKEAQEIAQRFPKTERGAQSLYWLAFNTHDLKEKVQIYLQLKNDFPPAKFGWSDDGMSGLFEVYMRTDPPAALALAKEMVAAKPDDKTWPALDAYADAVVNANRLVADGRAADAVTYLDSIKLPRQQNASPFYLAKAAAQDAAGDPQKAYDTLLAQMGQSPTVSLHAALLRAGAKLKKTESQVSADLWALLETKAKPATELDTTSFVDGKKVSLADYRGKVVLLNFWYPFCGPCRGEFPYLQAILDKYKAKGFEIISPSVHPLEDHLVLPYMTGMHFGFLPVHSDSEFAEKNYGARGFPANFLIDQQGRIVYKPTVIRGEDAQQTLELQIETVLEHGSK